MSTADIALQLRLRRLLHAPLLPTLLRLAAPNVLGLFATTLVIGYDGFVLGRLGADALAGVALVFPLSMLMLHMSAGGIGGATTAAVARALGAGERAQADRLALHALLVGGAMAALFMLALLGFGATVYAAMGGRGAALASALAYSNVLFAGSLVVWLTNVLAGVARGAGNMLLPSLMLVTTALVHLVLCPLLVFGAGGWAGLGVAGAAASTLVANGVAALVLLAHLLRRDGAVSLLRAPLRLDLPALRALLRVGLPASLTPVISNGSVAVATALVGHYGTVALAGYGVAARLEYILVPIAFGFGTALTTLVATNLGAGDRARALRATWLGAGVVAGLTGAIGIGAALSPATWMNLFTADAAVRAFGGAYLAIVGPAYACFGLGLALLFASQGAGRMFWPLVGSASRFVILAAGGWLCVHVLQAPPGALAGVVALSLAAFAAIIALAIQRGRWGT
jgi:putative MATE family efflux protein